jgi:phage shock protein A
MALLERVGTLLRANLNELIEKAEEPERLLKQIVLDMENQLMQVKTQVAIAIAGEHLLEKKRAEQERETAEWRMKAELAVTKGHDDLARAALERSLSHTELEKGFAAQMEDQKHETENLRQALRKLEQKLNETRARSEMLVAEHRRARAVGRAAEARHVAGFDKAHAMDRMKSRVHASSAESAAATEIMAEESLEDKFRALESEDRVEALLNEIKSRQTEIKTLPPVAQA